LREEERARPSWSINECHAVFFEVKKIVEKIKKFFERKIKKLFENQAVLRVKNQAVLGVENKVLRV